MRRLLLVFSLLLYTTACAPHMALHAPWPAGDQPRDGESHFPAAMSRTTPRVTDDRAAPWPGLLVTTADRSQVLFPADDWTLTTAGIRGNALVTTADGQQFTADTTLAYVDAVSASPTERGVTMNQFLLTILGVILVLGLVAIIIYAAFLATAR
ncbi:MAG: hypothetical protein KFH87_04140 [Bacteroidetes bacterium]|nr:hypothetical protein [Bacteroidota bacterium]